MKTLTVLALFFLLLCSHFGLAQTCCSGGVPLSAGLGLPPEEKQTLQLQLSYDLNVLQTLKTGTEVIDDDSRTRRTHSILLQGGYSFTERLSADLLFSWVQQDRRIRQFGQEELTQTSGIGDAVLLLKYRLFGSTQTTTVASAGLGLKAPLGPSDLRRDDGLTINADLQPGSGAWDAILWGQIIHSFSSRPSLSLSATAVYSQKGSNNEYLGVQRYRFGNELQVIAAIADRFLMGAKILDPSLSLRYRSIGPDQLNDQEVPSTGGNWLFVNPALSYWFHPNYAIQGRMEIPLIADITGTQVSPSYRLNLGFFAKIGLKKQDLKLDF